MIAEEKTDESTTREANEAAVSWLEKSLAEDRKKAEAEVRTIYKKSFIKGSQKCIFLLLSNKLK